MLVDHVVGGEEHKALTFTEEGSMRFSLYLISDVVTSPKTSSKDWPRSVKAGTMRPPSAAQRRGERKVLNVELSTAGEGGGGERCEEAVRDE